MFFMANLWMASDQRCHWWNPLLKQDKQDKPLLSFLRHNMKYNILAPVFVCACGVVDCCGLLWCGDGGRQAKTEADDSDDVVRCLLKLQ